jgi:hypothetical protein
MKKRKTVERWIADVLGQRPDLVRKADEMDRKIDNGVGAQIRSAADKTPETDWRRLTLKDSKDEGDFK